VTAEETGRTAKGGWIEVNYGDPETGPATATGEFLGFRLHELYVLSEAGVLAVPAQSVERARLRGYAPDKEGMVFWTVVGSVSTVSHGFFLLASLPTWIACGSLATAGQSRSGLMDYRPEKAAIGDLAMYARFPAGIPEGLNLSDWRLDVRAMQPPAARMRRARP
jgi:hypothetical protein